MPAYAFARECVCGTLVTFRGDQFQAEFSRACPSCGRVNTQPNPLGAVVVAAHAPVTTEEFVNALGQARSADEAMQNAKNLFRGRP